MGGDQEGGRDYSLGGRDYSLRGRGHFTATTSYGESANFTSGYTDGSTQIYTYLNF